MEKHYNKDWAKVKSRELVREMIGRTLLKFRKPKQLSVLCLPGIDAEEIFQVYDSLGIPRGNVVGVEREPDIADEIEKKNLGIKLVRGSLEDYVSGQDMVDFDIISLDYTGAINLEQVVAIQDVFRKQRKNHFVFHCANLIKRDHNSLPIYTYSHVLDNVDEELNHPVEGVSPARLTRGIVERSNSISAKIENKDNLADVKKSAYSYFLAGLVSGMDNDSVVRMLKFVVGEEYPGLLRYLSGQLSKFFGKEIVLDEGKPIASAPGSPLIVHMFDQVTWQYVARRCEQHGIFGQEYHLLIQTALSDVVKEHKFFKERDVVTYSYVSESGAPMIGNVYFLSYPERAVQAARELTRVIGYPDRFHISDMNRTIEVYSLVQNYVSALIKFMGPDCGKELFFKERDRLFLGSSARPILTKAKAIEEFRGGAAVAELKEKYRGWSNKPLAQWKAHVTMGTYDTEKSTAEDENGLEKITKEEALDMISSNIPLEEIFEAYPGSFTIGQLRAFKAHLTMGTYDKNG